MVPQILDHHVFVFICLQIVLNLFNDVWLFSSILFSFYMLMCFSNFAIPLLYLSKKNDSTNLKRYLYIYVHCSIMHNSQNIEATKVPIDRWICKEEIYKYNAILLSHKKEWSFAICNNLKQHELKSIMLSEKSQRQIHHDSTYIWNL